MRRVRSQDRLQGFDPEPERTFQRRLREARDTNNIQALVQFPVDMAEEQPMAVREVAIPSIANVTYRIVKPRITGHFELKQSMIQLLHANVQFMGLPHEDPHQHILNFLEISDTYITNGVTPDYVRLTRFPFSLLGEAKRWLKAEPANSIITWNDLARKFMARFFPSGKTAKIRTWEWFKGLLKDCPHHNQTNEVLAHTFIEGLHSETKIAVGAAAGGQVLEKSFDEIYALLKKFSKSNPDWQREMGRHSAKVCRASPRHNNEKFGASNGAACHAQNTRPVGALLSETEANPRAALNAVSLRNGRQLEEVQSKKRKKVTFNERPTTIESTSEKAKELEKPAGEAVAEQPPQLVHINIPLVDILQEVTKYAKYIKYIVANKRRLTEFETVALTEECSSRIQGKLPQKLKDPGSFTIQISIGKHDVGQALCDLGASINLMPLSVFRQLGLGEPRPTTVIL
ncbi:uncharacterized protein [Nicotiana sylvestris]|uniref:uncharacterized protein n=1 Tax=Nicotiana sylvestris TaxID=4096 RepID=UPI00388C3D71